MRVFEGWVSFGREDDHRWSGTIRGSSELKVDVEGSGVSSFFDAFAEESGGIFVL